MFVTSVSLQPNTRIESVIFSKSESRKKKVTSLIEKKEKMEAIELEMEKLKERKEKLLTSNPEKSQRVSELLRVVENDMETSESYLKTLQDLIKFDEGVIKREKEKIHLLGKILKVYPQLSPETKHARSLIRDGILNIPKNEEEKILEKQLIGPLGRALEKQKKIGNEKVSLKQKFRSQDYETK
jgi:outer membrane translocation and assembly module TamA